MTSGTDFGGGGRRQNPVNQRGDGGASFPDISGEWAMEIAWQRDGRHGKIDATAFINQDSSRISMTVRSEGSDSRTILAQPGDDGAGSPVLHYIYEIDPKAIGSDASGPYKGAAILRLYGEGQELSGNYWTSQLSKGHFKLNRKRNEVGGGVNQTVDVVLITAIKQEFEAAKKAFSATELDGDGVPAWEKRSASAASYWVGQFQCDGVALFRIALAQSSRMGSNRTGQLAAVLVAQLSPKCLVMCGVCAGNPKDLALGDIIVSELAYQYDEGKLDEDGFMGDHRQSSISPAWQRAAEALRAEALPSYGSPNSSDARYWLLERIHGNDDPLNHPARQRYFNTGEWREMIEALKGEGMIETEGRIIRLTKAGVSEVEQSLLLDVDPPAKLPLAIKIGPIASGNVVVKDGVTWDKLRHMGLRSVLGLEMEAAAIGEVARSSGVEWIVFKGVMDHADPKKDDRYKSFAARASAEALRQFLTDHFLDIEQGGSPEALPR